MIWVFCEVTDLAAFWAIGRLQERGIRVELVTAPALGSAMRWEHRINNAGSLVEIRLRDGRVLSSIEGAGVLNRLAQAPIDRIGGEDRDYVIQEMNALYLSWLHALPGPVLNRPTPQGLSGYWRHPSVWAALARRAGMGAQPFRQSSEDDPAAAWLWQPAVATVIAVGGQAIAPPHLPAATVEGCLRLAMLAGTGLLGIDLTQTPDGAWLLLGASPLPDLARGGERLVDALAEALTL